MLSNIYCEICGKKIMPTEYDEFDKKCPECFEKRFDKKEEKENK